MLTEADLLAPIGTAFILLINDYADDGAPSGSILTYYGVASDTNYDVVPPVAERHMFYVVFTDHQPFILHENAVQIATTAEIEMALNKSAVICEKHQNFTAAQYGASDPLVINKAMFYGSHNALVRAYYFSIGQEPPPLILDPAILATPAYPYNYRYVLPGELTQE